MAGIYLLPAYTIAKAVGEDISIVSNFLQDPLQDEIEISINEQAVATNNSLIPQGNLIEVYDHNEVNSVFIEVDENGHLSLTSTNQTVLDQYEIDSEGHLIFTT